MGQFWEKGGRKDLLGDHLVYWVIPHPACTGASCTPLPLLIRYILKEGLKTFTDMGQIRAS